MNIIHEINKMSNYLDNNKSKYDSLDWNYQKLRLQSMTNIGNGTNYHIFRVFNNIIMINEAYQQLLKRKFEHNSSKNNRLSFDITSCNRDISLLKSLRDEHYQEYERHIEILLNSNNMMVAIEAKKLKNLEIMSSLSLINFRQIY